MRRRSMGCLPSVTEEALPWCRKPHPALRDAEIAQLRLVEAEYQRGNEELDRVQRALVGAHPGHLVLYPGLPPGTWCRLPVGWHCLAPGTPVTLTPLWPPIPLDVKGPVGVSLGLAREMVR
jgi:hypothetical protein